MKIIPLLSIFLVMFLGPSKCSEAIKIDKKAPMALGDVYLEYSSSDASITNSGFNLIIPITDKELQGVLLDSVYFRNQITKLTKIAAASGDFYRGVFNSTKRTNGDIILSSDPMDEMANKPPVVAPKIPFELNSTEALISYNRNGKTQYFKIENIIDKTSK